jgi:hypothetical protein
VALAHVDLVVPMREMFLLMVSLLKRDMMVLMLFLF